MSRRALYGGMILLLLVASLLAGARPASADTGLGMRAWRWLVTVWVAAGPEIDPNGHQVEVPPPPPPVKPDAATGGATSGRQANPEPAGQAGHRQAPAPR